MFSIIPCSMLLYNMIFFSFATAIADVTDTFMEMFTLGLWTEEFESIKEVTAGSCTASLEM